MAFSNLQYLLTLIMITQCRDFLLRSYRFFILFELLIKITVNILQTLNWLRRPGVLCKRGYLLSSLQLTCDIKVGKRIVGIPI